MNAKNDCKNFKGGYNIWWMLEKEMENNKVYVVLLGMDYEGYASFHLFSSFERAKEYADKIILESTESVEIVIKRIDDSEFYEETGYYRSYVRPKKNKKVKKSKIILKTSDEWNRLCNLIIIDPDGWDREDFDFSWYEEKITKEEFEKRAFMSTIQFSITNSINYYETIKNIWKEEEKQN